MTPETKLKNQVIKYLKTLEGCWYYKSSDRFTSGIPDLLICFRGHFVALELKAPKGKVSKLQSHTLAAIGDAKGSTSVCKTLLEVKTLFEELSLEIPLPIDYQLARTHLEER